MRLFVTILLIIFSIKSFSQVKENNGTIYKNGPYVEAVKNLMNVVIKIDVNLNYQKKVLHLIQFYHM